MAQPRDDGRLHRLSSLCLALPEAEVTRCGAHADFRVRGKVFAYFLHDYQGDGITAACFKSGLGEHIEQVKRDSVRCYLPRCLGLRGWFGVRLDVGVTDWDEIAALAARSYQLVAQSARRQPLAAAEPVQARPHTGENRHMAGPGLTSSWPAA